MIPQDATLFAGTIRSNLDPFKQFEDVKLWEALRRAHLVDSSPNHTILRSHDTSEVLSLLNEKASNGAGFSLDSIVEDGGANLSVGQRSLVSLARALVKDSPIILLDEATASADHETVSHLASRAEMIAKWIVTRTRLFRLRLRPSSKARR